MEAFGLYPVHDSDQCTSTIRTVPGHIVDEMFNHGIQRIDRKLIIRLDAADFYRSRQIARQWGCRHEFSILSRDCVEFVRAVGNSLDLNMPRRSIAHCTPQGYIRALLDSVTVGSVKIRDGVYEGSLMGNAPMGRGILTMPGECRIQGTFWGTRHHVGTGVLSGRYRYDGAIVDYQAHGQGTVYLDEKRILTARFDHGTLRNVIRYYRRTPKSELATLAFAAPHAVK